MTLTGLAPFLTAVVAAAVAFLVIVAAVEFSAWRGRRRVARDKARRIAAALADFVIADAEFRGLR